LELGPDQAVIGALQLREKASNVLPYIVARIVDEELIEYNALDDWLDSILGNDVPRRKLTALLRFATRVAPLLDDVALALDQVGWSKMQDIMPAFISADDVEVRKQLLSNASVMSRSELDTWLKQSGLRKPQGVEKVGSGYAAYLGNGRVVFFVVVDDDNEAIARVERAIRSVAGDIGLADGAQDVLRLAELQE
jgi:hypothetical protein